MDKYSKDELEAPEWLNSSFLGEILKQNEEGNNVIVTNFKVSPAAEKGEHFASIMFRIAVDYLVSDNLKHISLILKTMPVIDGVKKDLVGGSNAFETEIKMYSEIIPKFHKILRNMGDETLLGARMIYSSLHPIKIIIFEDLTKLGYQMIPNKCLEPYELDALLKKICRWHAISFKLLHDGDESIKGLKDGVFNLGGHLEDWLNDGINGFSKLLNNQIIDPIYTNKFEKIKYTLIEKCKSFSQLKSDFCVLNHGDFHMNNMMVKFGQNEDIDDLMLVDFQFCVAATLAIDLTYLLTAIINPESRDQRDEIIYKYHTLFVEILHKLEYQGYVPTLLDIHRELMLHKELEVIMIVGFLPFICVLKEKVEIADEVMEDPKVFLSFFEHPAYINIIKNMLPELLHKGYLD